VTELAQGVNCGLPLILRLGAPQLLDEVRDVLLSDLLVGGRAHLAEHILWVDFVLGVETSLADQGGEHQLGGSLQVGLAGDGAGLDQLEDLVDQILGGGLDVVAEGGDHQELLNLRHLVLLDHLLEEDDAGRGPGVPHDLNVQGPGGVLLLLGGGGGGLELLVHLLEVLGLHNGQDGLQRLQFGGNFLLSELL